MRQQLGLSSMPWYETVDFILPTNSPKKHQFDWGYSKAFIGFYCHHLEWERSMIINFIIFPFLLGRKKKLNRQQIAAEFSSFPRECLLVALRALLWVLNGRLSLESFLIFERFYRFTFALWKLDLLKAFFPLESFQFDLHELDWGYQRSHSNLDSCLLFFISSSSCRLILYLPHLNAF